MSNVSTFGGFSTARLGIYASQKGMEVVGNNISNINTPGYTRQRLEQKALHVGGADHYSITSDIRVGAGALCTGVSQLRDPYLDIRYRTEMSNVGAADRRLTGLQRLTAIFDEVAKGEEDDGVLELAMKELFDKIQDVNGHAGRDVYNNIVRGSAESLVRWFNDYAKQLEEVRNDQEKIFNQDVDRVNVILKGIQELNDQIKKENIHGGDALELKDERNMLIDELAGYARINVKYSEENIGAGMTVEKLTITLAEPGSPIGGKVLIDGKYCAQFARQMEQVPKRDSQGNIVYQVDDKGQAILDGNGNRIPVMVDTDEPDPLYRLKLTMLKDSQGHIKPGEEEKMATDPDYFKLGDTEMYGSLQSSREMLTEKGEYATDEDLAIDPDAATKRGIPYYIKALDHLANKFAAWMNEANTISPEANPELYYGQMEPVDPGDPTQGEHYVYYDGDPNNGGNPLPDQSDLSGAVIKAEYEDFVKEMKQGVLFSNDGSGNETDNITAKNISISKGWSTDTVQLVQTKDPDRSDESTANDNLNHFVALMTKTLEFKPNDIIEGGDEESYFSGSFFGMLTKINSTLANDTKTTGETLDNYSIASEDLYLEREGVSGVDLNDETIDMMKYQKSYTAACRLLTTIDEMLERLISNTGLAGR